MEPDPIVVRGAVEDVVDAEDITAGIALAGKMRKKASQMRMVNMVRQNCIAVHRLFNCRLFFFARHHHDSDKQPKATNIYQMLFFSA